ncbi:MAG: alkaline phosphatase D family protein [Bacteroidetes bacterium]|nr:alkaline phosphatase D family protein [Bacteroidota bacterium]
MRYIIILIVCLIAGCNPASRTSQTEMALTGSPILGDLGMRHAKVWCQVTPNEGSENPTLSLLDSAGVRLSLLPMQSMELGNCYQSEFSNLLPGSKYAYFVGDELGMAISDTLSFQTQPLWQYRTDPPELKFLVGSCTYVNEPEFDRPGKPYGGGYEIFETMAQEDFNAMLWLGDNVYLREVDFSSKSGFIHRYNQTRNLPELQSLLSEGVHYAIWDDHDFGPNDCDGSWIHQDWSRDVFHAYWPNPESGIPDAEELNVTQFLFGDVEFFLLDNRSHRVNHSMGSEKRQILGSVQRNWLLNALRNSRAPFKMVAIGGQMVSDAAIFENFAQFPEEREILFNQIDALGIRGVVFLTGDRHNSELSKMKLPGGNWVYDVTVSPLTSGSDDHTDEPNTLREPGTMVGVRNYGVLEVTGPRKERVLTVTVNDAGGEPLWSRSIHAGDAYALTGGL